MVVFGRAKWLGLTFFLGGGQMSGHSVDQAALLDGTLTVRKHRGMQTTALNWTLDSQSRHVHSHKHPHLLHIEYRRV